MCPSHCVSKDPDGAKLGAPRVGAVRALLAAAIGAPAVASVLAVDCHRPLTGHMHPSNSACFYFPRPSNLYL